MNMLSILILLLFSYSDAFAKDLGVQGTVFEIKEPDLMRQMQAKLGQLSPEELKIHQQKLQEKMKNSIEEPRSLKNIYRATKSRVFTYDPSFVVDRDYKDHQGNLIALKGTKINPLDHLTYEKELIFIDATDETQLEWLKLLPKRPRKIILVAGRPFDLEKKISEEVYFDQKGFITGKFGITAVPARAWQNGKIFQIEEVAYEN